MSGKEHWREIVVKQAASQATLYAADRVKDIIRQAVNDRGLCRIALAGGITPRELYTVLAGPAFGDKIPWRKIEVFFGDERDVPQDHAESNFGMVQRTLLDHVPIEPGRVHPMGGDADDLDAAATDYEAAIRRYLVAGNSGIPVFDLILLGMGGEGHVASLFPGTDVLREEEKLVASCFVPVLGRRRMTFTYPLINAARNVLLLVIGADKASAIARLLGPDEQARCSLPVCQVHPTDGKLMLILDASAAHTWRNTSAEQD